MADRSILLGGDFDVSLKDGQWRARRGERWSAVKAESVVWRRNGEKEEIR